MLHISVLAIVMIIDKQYPPVAPVYEITLPSKDYFIANRYDGASILGQGPI